MPLCLSRIIRYRSMNHSRGVRPLIWYRWASAGMPRRLTYSLKRRPVFSSSDLRTSSLARPNESAVLATLQAGKSAGQADIPCRSRSLRAVLRVLCQLWQRHENPARKESSEDPWQDRSRIAPEPWRVKNPIDVVDYCVLADRIPLIMRSESGERCIRNIVDAL